MKILQYSKWDAVCVLCGLLHFAYVLTFFLVFPYAPWWVSVCLGLIYSVSVSWNINGVSHNLIHNPFFKSRILNRLFSIMESVTLGISQTFYKHVHHRHHMGNSDRPDEHGHTHDWISIYRHGHNGEAENPWSYIFLSYIREDPRRPSMPRLKEKIRSMRDGESRKLCSGSNDRHWPRDKLEILGLLSTLLLPGTLLHLFERLFPPLWR